MKKIIIIVVTAALMLPFALQAHADPADTKLTSPTIYQEPKGGTSILPTLTGGYSVANPEDVLNDKIVKMINMTSNVFIGFSVLFIVLAGIQYVWARGDEEKIKQSHQSVLWATFGIVLIMLSYAIIFVINSIF